MLFKKQKQHIFQEKMSPAGGDEKAVGACLQMDQDLGHQYARALPQQMSAACP